MQDFFHRQYVPQRQAFCQLFPLPFVFGGLGDLGLCHGKTGNPWPPRGWSLLRISWNMVPMCPVVPATSVSCGFWGWDNDKNVKTPGERKKDNSWLKIRFCKRTSSLFVKTTEQGHKNIRHFFHKVTWSWMYPLFSPLTQIIWTSLNLYNCFFFWFLCTLNLSKNPIVHPSFCEESLRSRPTATGLHACCTWSEACASFASWL